MWSIIYEVDWLAASVSPVVGGAVLATFFYRWRTICKFLLQVQVQVAEKSVKHFCPKECQETLTKYLFRPRSIHTSQQKPNPPDSLND
jgi:hypothetical protein